MFCSGFYNYYFLDFGSRVGSYLCHRAAEVGRDLWAQNTPELTYALRIWYKTENELPNSPWVCACTGALTTWLPWGILATAEGCSENGAAAALSFCSSELEKHWEREREREKHLGSGKSVFFSNFSCWLFFFPCPSALVSPFLKALWLCHHSATLKGSLLPGDKKSRAHWGADALPEPGPLSPLRPCPGVLCPRPSPV